MDPVAFRVVLDWITRAPPIEHDEHDTAAALWIFYICVKANQPEQVLGAFRHMQQQGVQPPVAIHSFLINAFVKTNQPFGDVIELTRGMQLQDPEFFTAPLYYLLHLFCEAKQPEKATMVVKEMQKQGMTPNAVTYSYLLNCLVMQNMPNFAIDIWGDMQRRGVPPNFLTYTSMIRAFRAANQPSRAKEIEEEEMRGMGEMWQPVDLNKE